MQTHPIPISGAPDTDFGYKIPISDTTDTDIRDSRYSRTEHLVHIGQDVSGRDRHRPEHASARMVFRGVEEREGRLDLIAGHEHLCRVPAGPTELIKQPLTLRCVHTQ